MYIVFSALQRLVNDIIGAVIDESRRDPVFAGKTHLTAQVMYSRILDDDDDYNDERVITLISPETGMMIVFGQKTPFDPVRFVAVRNNTNITSGPEEVIAWSCPLVLSQSIMSKQECAKLVMDVFRSITHLDSDDEFTEKMNAVLKAHPNRSFEEKGSFTKFDLDSFSI